VITTTAKPDYCRPCVGYRWGNCKGFSRVTGDNRVPLLFVGESSGASEAKRGEPFVGAAGQVLEKAFRTAGLKRSDYNLTNLLRCRPPDNELRGAPYEFAALAHCRKYLDDAVTERRPKIIVALGDLPLRELSAIPVTQSEHRGYVLPSIYAGVSVIGTFHPSRILRGDWKLFGILMHDIKRAVSIARNGIPAPAPTNYITDPTTDQIRDYIELLRSQPQLPISYDTETPELIGVPSDGRTIMLMQFSSSPGTAIALTPDRMDAARIIMALPNPKWGWADRTFDRALLRANGFTLNGELHDLMNALAHLQPSFMSSKDETSGEKNIPAKLMSLQSCVSLYEPWEQPWKRLVRDFMEANPDASHDSLMAVVKQYGCRDVDHTVRCGLKLFAALRSSDLYDGYYEHKFHFSFVLDDISANGLPVDRERQTKVRNKIAAEDARLLREIQAVVPEELQALHPVFGYAKPPKWALEKIENGYDAANPPLVELSNSRGYLVQRMVTADVINKVETECETCVGSGSVPGARRMKKCPKCKGIGYRWQKDGRISRDELRWALTLFNPNSSQHVLAYIEHMGYPVPLHIDTKRPTVGQKEIEGLIDDTDDETLKLVSKIKKLTKLGGTYCGGDWVPGDDGRVHGQFRFGTASGQTSCIKPNCFSDDTEILTKRGWVEFPRLTKDDEVAQYDIGGHICFVKPLKIVNRTGNNPLVRITTEQQIDLLVTEDHLCLLQNRKTKKFGKFPASDYPEDRIQVQAGQYVGGKESLTWGQVTLICALQADGYVEPRGGAIEFALSRVRKIKRLLEALKACDVTFSQRPQTRYWKGSPRERQRFYIKAKDVPAWLRGKKIFGQWLLDMDKRTFQMFADEVFYWDGLSTRKNNYSSSVKTNTDWVQILMVLTGRRAKIRKYRDPKFPKMKDSWQLDVAKNTYSMTTNRSLKIIANMRPVYCVTVHHGNVVVRHNGKVAVTGNCQQWPSHFDPDDKWLEPFMQQIKGCIRAQPGHVFVKIDAKGAHSRMQAFLAEDPDYYHLSNLGTHAFNTAHYVGVPDRNELLAMDDGALLRRLSEIKRQYDYEYNFAKRVSFNMQYLGGPQKAAHTLRVPVIEVVALMELIKGLFPKSFVEYPETVRKRLQQNPRLVSAHKSCRWIWDGDEQQAVAFCVANEFHCHWQSGLVRLRERGLLRRYEAVNFCHDDLWLHPTEDLADDCIALCRAELERPSTVLTNSLGAFQVNTEIQTGYDMLNLRDV
jgi:uracil-DNA glycosylase family 4